NPLNCRSRILIRTGTVGCTLCAFYERSLIIETQKLKRCSHRGEAGEALRWLEMFRRYRVCGGGLGARCSHGLKHGNEKEAREKQNVWYHEVQCTWIKTIQRFVTSCMMVHGSRNNGSVSRLGRTALEVMGWQDWRGLEENGTENIRSWLEEMGDMRGLRCPRLLVLFLLLAECLSSEEQGAD
ncbi:hypothetical protein IWW34DRAFT_575938, partial [Fusarium oxysporum f. sp. albedinis]